MTRPALIFLAILISPALLAAKAPQLPPPNSPPAKRIDIPAAPSKANDSFEDWTLELTPEYWPLEATGKVTSQSVSSDMKQDLGISSWKSEPMGRLIGQWNKNKIIVEGARYQLNGAKTIQQTVQVNGTTATLDDSTEAHLKINYVYAGYEKDVLSGRQGFLGVNGGLTFLEGESNLSDDTRAISQNNNNRGLFPVVGGAFRYLPIHYYAFNVNGEFKGMNLGNYGFYLQSEANFGFSLTPHFTIQAGYSRLAMNLHDKNDVSGIRGVFKGPIFSVQYRMK